jgi:two-component system NtrC family response regulator
MDILIVEDGASQRALLCDFLREENHQVKEAANAETALEKIQKNYFDVLVIDYKMPGQNGLELLKAVKAINPEIDVIMMTAYGTINTAVEAMKAGAFDYITKPVDLDELLLQLDHIAENRQLKKENALLKEALKDQKITADQIIFQSSAMNKVMNLASRVAESNATVLIQGESGTGKELLAHLIHSLSRRASHPLVTVNCAALSENLLESELFGHEKGAFTGAVHQRIGRFEKADGGTLFLDEIGEVTPLVQVKLLRFLQEREFQRVGGNDTLRSDVRIISATNRNLQQRVRNGNFREDLFYRLNVVSMEIPPLRNRKEDLPLLINHFLKRFARENRKKLEGVSAEAHDLLLKYDYPGNIRELENIMERAVVITRGTLISRRDLPFDNTVSTSFSATATSADSRQTLKTALESLESRMIIKALESTGQHQSRAAEKLGISERMLRYKLKKHQLK